MARYNFTSPGAEAGAGILDILTQRRLEERQRMLDEIAAKDSESRRAQTEQQIKASQEAVQGAAQQRELTQLAAGEEGLEPGDQPPADLMNLFQKYGKVRAPKMEEVPGEVVPFQNPQVGEVGDITGPMEGVGEVVKPKFTKGGYVGSKEDRTRKRRFDQMGNVIGSMSDENVPYMEKLLRIAQAIEDPNLPGTFYTALDREQPQYTIDDETGKISRAVDPVTNEPIRGSSRVTHIPRPYRPLREPRTAGTFLDRPVIDEATGKPDPTKAFMIQDGQLTVVPVPSGLRMGARASTAKPTMVPAGLRQEYAKALADLEASKPWYSDTPSTETETKVNNLRQAIIGYATSPSVKEAVRDTLEDPASANVPANAMAEMLEEAGVFTSEDEKTQFIDVLSSIRTK